MNIKQTYITYACSDYGPLSKNKLLTFLDDVINTFGDEKYYAVEIIYENCNRKYGNIISRTKLGSETFEKRKNEFVKPCSCNSLTDIKDYVEKYADRFIPNDNIYHLKVVFVADFDDNEKSFKIRKQK